MNNFIGIPCIKTGCAVYCHESNKSYWADLFDLDAEDGTFLVRFNKNSEEDGDTVSQDENKDLFDCHEILYVEADAPFGTMIGKGYYYKR